MLTSTRFHHLAVFITVAACGPVAGTGAGESSSTAVETGGDTETGTPAGPPTTCVGAYAERWACLTELTVRCQAVTSAADCSGRWSATDYAVLTPTELACLWHPEVVRVNAVAESCEVVERAGMCLGVLLANDPAEPIGDPRCEPFEGLTCGAGQQFGRAQMRRLSNTDVLLAQAVECGAIVGFESDNDRCGGDEPTYACGCFCE